MVLINVILHINMHINTHINNSTSCNANANINACINVNLIVNNNININICNNSNVSFNNLQILVLILVFALFERTERWTAGHTKERHGQEGAFVFLLLLTRQTIRRPQSNGHNGHTTGGARARRWACRSPARPSTKRSSRTPPHRPDAAPAAIQRTRGNA